MILSLLVGALVGIAYCFSLQKTATSDSRYTANGELFRSLSFFFLRLLLTVFTFIFLARYTQLDMTFVIITFTIVFSVFLFRMAGKAFFHDINKKQIQAKGRM